MRQGSVIKAVELIDPLLIISSGDELLGFDDLWAGSSRSQQPQEAVPVTIEEESNSEDEDSEVPSGIVAFT